MKYLPIKIKDVKYLVNSYENWYNTFDKRVTNMLLSN